MYVKYFLNKEPFMIGELKEKPKKGDIIEIEDKKYKIILCAWFFYEKMPFVALEAI
jgi:hypothetical protein